MPDIINIMAVKKKYCQNGHLFSGENIRYSNQNGRIKRTCRTCNNEWHKNQKAAERKKRFMDNPEGASRYYRNRKLKENYGISIEEFEKILSEQNGQCFICNFVFSNESYASKPCMDHCHKTNKIRRILCHSCNRGLGLLKENPTILRKLADYIESYQ